jgi:4-hydroxy-4-methyl-2-oxoglutarate aldolase
MSWAPEFYLLSTGNVADAAIGLVKVMDSGMRALDVGMKVFGPAYTVECTGGNNLPIFEAVSMAPPGSVVTVNVHGHMQSGHVGDILATAAQIRGIAGIVLDGACRDVDDVIKLKFPVFARGSNPHGTLKLKNGKLNKPTECGGVMVHPGDLIFGDASGVLVFSPADAEQILQKAKEVAIREIEIFKRLRTGKSAIEILADLVVSAKH